MFTISLLRRRLLTPLVLALALAVGIRAQTGGFAQPERLDAALGALAAKSILPAFAVIGVERDGREYSFYRGKEVWEAERPLNGNSLFRIYSMTKPIASIAAMQLVEQGKLTLDEPLGKWLPAMMAIPVLQPDGRLAPSATPITLRQLLTHTAGFAYTFTNAELRAFQKPADWPHQDGPRVFEPGARWNYGTNTDWVGRLIEKVSGLDLETYLRRHVTGPLGMTRTFFVVPDDLQDEIVSLGSVEGGETPRMAETKNARRQTTKPKEYNAGGGLFSTPRDYGRFVRMVLNGGSLDGVRILRRETLELMFQNHIGEKIVTTFGGRDQWGLGWAIDPTGRHGRSPGTIYWAGAANTYFSIDLQKGRAVMVFSNFFPMLSKHARSLVADAEQLLYPEP